MITEEQLKNLKKGDKVLAEVEVTEICCNDCIEAVYLAYIDDKEELRYSADNFHRSCLTLPPDKPKYDPCRRFKEGDKVRIVQYKGRDYCDEVKIYRGKITEVLSDEEDYYVEINIRIGGITLGIDPAYLELVTPVEERMNGK